MAPKTITLAECQEHMSDKDCWLVIEGKVNRGGARHQAGRSLLLAQAGNTAWLTLECSSMPLCVDSRV